MFRKVGTRAAQAISKIVAAGLLWTAKDGTVTDVRVALGSMAPTARRLREAESSLVGRRLAPDTARQAAALLAEDVAPIDDVRSTASYRLATAQRLLEGFLTPAVLNLHRRPGDQESYRRSGDQESDFQITKKTPDLLISCDHPRTGTPDLLIPLDLDLLIIPRAGLAGYAVPVGTAQAVEVVDDARRRARSPRTPAVRIPPSARRRCRRSRSRPRSSAQHGDVGRRADREVSERRCRICLAGFHVDRAITSASGTPSARNLLMTLSMSFMPAFMLAMCRSVEIESGRKPRLDDWHGNPPAETAGAMADVEHHARWRAPARAQGWRGRRGARV